MAERISAHQRMKMQHAAQKECMRYAHDDALWHKHVHNVELDSMQILKCIEMDEHPYTIDNSCRRTGKTAGKQLYNIKKLATTPDQELGIVAPREAQALVNLSYMTDAIRRSEILSGMVAYKSGRKMLSDTRFEFANRSKAQAYGIFAQVDGGDLTLADLEEVDDMPADRLYSRFLLMMGSARRLGASKEAKNDPEIRITGVFKGADTLADMIKSGTYHLLPSVNCYMGMEMGILQESFLMDMRSRLSPDEFMRQMLCINTSSKNLIWEKKVRKAIHVGLKAKLELIEPMPGCEYKKRGLISFGYDAAGHGEDPNASRHALVVAEQVGNYICFIYAKEWPAGADDMVVKSDLLELYRYFMPDEALGDAYAVAMLAQLNDELFRAGLTKIDRRTIGDGQSTASTWPEWAFSPIRFEGMVKHQMAQSLRSVFHNHHVAIPYVDDLEEGKESVVDDFMRLIRQLTNIAELPTKMAYSSYKMVKKELGDDLFDGAMEAVWALATRGVANSESIISLNTISREQLLGGMTSIGLPSKAYS